MVLSLSSGLDSASGPFLGPSQASVWQELALFPTLSTPHSPEGEAVCRDPTRLCDHQFHGAGFRGGLVNKWHSAVPELWPLFRISAKCDGGHWRPLTPGECCDFCKPTGPPPQNRARAIFLPVALILGKEPPPPSLGGVPEAEGPVWTPGVAAEGLRRCRRRKS